MTKIVIYDTNIFIDLHNVGLLEVVAHSDWEVHTTSIITSELLNPSWNKVSAIMPGLHVYKYDTLEQFQRLYDFRDRLMPRRNLSAADCSVLLLAQDLAAPLYTGDGPLRRIAIEQGLVVHGSIGIILMLYKQQLISLSQSKEALLKLKQNNSRINPKLIDDAINQLSMTAN